jgi:mRNA-degrading endonuclease RelE of RelBE toxin-antitoxin system
MAYRYAFSSACARDVQDLAGARQYPLLVQLLIAHLPTILVDPRGRGEPKRGPLRGCYGFALARGTGAAYRLVYEIHGDVVLLLALGEHDAAYRDAERRR